MVTYAYGYNAIRDNKEGLTFMASYYKKCKTYTISPTDTATIPISVDQPYAGPAASCCNINGTHSIHVETTCKLGSYFNIK
jgi:hypothetical protein